MLWYDSPPYQRTGSPKKPHRHPDILKTIFLSTILILTLALSPTLAQDIDAMPEDHPVSLSGVVVSAELDSFVLDYGEGEVHSWLNRSAF